MTPRELVLQTLALKNTSHRAPRDLWRLDWAKLHHPEALAAIDRDFPSDFVGAPQVLAQPTIEQGHQMAVGSYVDPWGCVFTNVQAGVVGEVKRPLVADEDWGDADRVHIPEELMTFDVAAVNAFCAASDRFVNGASLPRPFEQLQFIRTSELLFLDLADPPKGMMAFLERMHDFYCRHMTAWAKTDVDYLTFMDDWGSQRSLLIRPESWRKIFAPLYRDYVDIAHRHGKKVFMHSDGYILDIIPDLIDMGVDALNAQIFCMGVENLAQFRGKITFWGEIDRQNLLPFGKRADIDAAVRLVRRTLWQDGGCIAQCEFGPGANPDNVRQVFESWA